VGVAVARAAPPARTVEEGGRGRCRSGATAAGWAGSAADASELGLRVVGQRWEEGSEGEEEEGGKDKMSRIRRLRRIIGF